MTNPLMKQTAKKHNDINISLNNEETELLINVLNMYNEKRGIVYQKLLEKVKSANVVWQHRIKNDEITDIKNKIMNKKPPAKRWGIE